ncbi:MAG TPA: molybdopterin cofactor-binding domain-containing protein [Thermoanaerobaculia bacterium]|nr:molybdopterin cofactor-binding domain-containing protein [Thermoanaerobaculia bacterium]
MRTRREFLGIALLGGPALALAFRAGGADAGEKTPFRPNAWIRIDPDDIVTLTVGKSEMGQGVRTALAVILADELEADWRNVRVVQAEPSAQFPNLGTGGSYSVRGSFRALRRAGATGREMLVAAAAAAWGVDRAACRAEEGTVIHEGKRFTYGELTAAAAKLPVPADPPLKRDFKLVGKSMKRIDGPDIVTGQARYGLDVKVPGMRYATIVRPPALGGSIKSFEAVDGVDVVRVSAGVAIVADRTWAALKARDRLKVEFDAGPHAGFSSAVYEQLLADAAKDPGYLLRQDGTTTTPARTLEATYHYPFYAHATVEPMNCTADVRADRAELWVPTQAPNAVQKEVARLLGLSPERITVHVTLLGGGFGRRLGWDYALEAAEISKAVKAPVQLLWTRSDDMKHGYFQAASRHEMSGGFDADGKLVAWTHKKIASLHNARGTPTQAELDDPNYYRDSASWGVYDIPYTIPNIETRYVRVPTHVPLGPWRAVFSPSSTFARECFLDELAHAAGADPLEYRLKLLQAPDVLAIDDLKIERPRLRAVLELLRTKSNWGKPLPSGHGRGVACNVYDGVTHVAYAAEVSVVKGQVHVDKVVGVIDCGLIVNPLGVVAQAESGIVWGLSSALKDAITFRDGGVEQSTYLDFDVLRIDETPKIEIHLVPSHGDEPYGIGEPTVPPIVPAVANAIFAATGKRVRRLPIRDL